MGKVGDFIKEQWNNDPSIRLVKRLFFRRQDEAEWYHRQARNYLNYRSKKFDFELGVQYCKQAIRLKPQNAIYHYTLGEAYLVAPSLAIIRGANVGFNLPRAAKLAIKEFQKVVKFKSDYAWAYCQLALAYEYLGDKEKAKDSCQAAIKLSPPQNIKDFAQNYLNALEAEIPASSDVDDALRKLEEESLKNLEQAITYREEGKFRLADKEFEQACQLAPNSTWLYRTMCELASEQIY